jgi:hypothetical protein
MGLHEMTQLALWDDLSRNIMFAKELSIAYRNSAEAQKSDVGELAKALKKSSKYLPGTFGFSDVRFNHGNQPSRVRYTEGQVLRLRVHVCVSVRGVFG